jgi:NADH-quinone oxidoreductase subunit F
MSITTNNRVTSLDDLKKRSAEFQSQLEKNIVISVCLGTGCQANSSDLVFSAFKEELEKKVNNKSRDGKGIILRRTGCHGYCERGPIVVIHPDGICYLGVKEDNVTEIVEKLLKGEIVESLLYKDGNTIIVKESDIPFYKYQELRVFRNRSKIDPFQITDYISQNGYQGLAKAIELNNPDQIIKTILDSGLKGRGGAGFLTGKKWELCRKAVSPTGIKYVVCNGDEGDPGAFMDRSLLESDPHSILEGMLIAALAIGSSKGYAYIRAEYPLAIKTFNHAINQTREFGLIGEKILGSNFDFDVEIYQGAGAFVCGEETALLRSIEGKRGMPKPKPPFPANEGLYSMPTLINNVETYSNIPQIILNGSDWFNSIGTETCKGTKIFALTGAVNNVGLVEVPMGISLRDIVFKIGGGIKKGKKFKAVQLGGPSGGCIPEKFLDVPIDYEKVKEVGAIMGSGGMIVLDEDTCMVDLSRYFMDFIQDESCGQCVPCRIGTKRMLEKLDSITKGTGEDGDIDKLIKLSNSIKETSLCGLGKTAPNPILSTIRYFIDEYNAHILQKKCPAVVCKEIISSPCQHTCPINTKAPTYISLIAAGRFEEAFNIILKDNPLPSLCSRVCHHPCERKCEAGKWGESISIRALKRSATDYALKEGIYPVKSKKEEQVTNNDKIAIIGSGPSGLVAGNDLADKGYDVTIFEKMEIPGGVPALHIPEYRLPKDILEKDIENIKNSGVKIITNTKIGKDILFDEILRDYKAVFIATGAHKSKKLNIPDEDTEGIKDALEFLSDVNLHKKVDLGKRIGVIGGGNVAVDAARTAARIKGCEKVILIYRRTEAEMPAFREEIEALKEEGIETQFLSTPARIITLNGKLKSVECIRMELGGIDESGRRKPVPIKGSEFIINLDNLLVAIGEEPDISFLKETSDIKTSRWNTIITDPETLATNMEGVFAGGDAVNGPATVIEAMAHGRIAAQMIDKYLQGKKLIREYAVTRPPMYLPPVELISQESGEAIAAEEPSLSLNNLFKNFDSNNFDSNNLNLIEEAAIKEARRCLRCDLETEDGKRAIKR